MGCRIFLLERSEEGDGDSPSYGVEIAGYVFLFIFLLVLVLIFRCLGAGSYCYGAMARDNKNEGEKDEHSQGGTEALKRGTFHLTLPLNRVGQAMHGVGTFTRKHFNKLIDQLFTFENEELPTFQEYWLLAQWPASVLIQ